MALWICSANLTCASRPFASSTRIGCETENIGGSFKGALEGDLDCDGDESGLVSSVGESSFKRLGEFSWDLDIPGVSSIVFTQLLRRFHEWSPRHVEVRRGKQLA